MTTGGSQVNSDMSRSSAQPLSAGTGALVIGDCYQALGIVRSLGRHGIPVWVLGNGHMSATMSRYARRALPWPPRDTTRQLDYLLNLATRHRLDGWVVFPTTDEYAALLARHHAVLAERFLLTTPSWESLRWAYDKRRTYRVAAELGIDYPWTRYPAETGIASLNPAFPAILKPAIKENVNRFTRAKAWRVADRPSLLARYNEACALVAPDVIMLQELIPGGGEEQFSFAALCMDGRALAWLVARRARQYPADFGRASTYVETVDRPEVVESAQNLLAAMRYTGLVEVEFKRDARTGCYKLLDVNARTWGWHSLGRRAGVDFPYLLWRLLHGEQVLEAHARSGVRWVRMLTDMPTAAREIMDGRLSPSDYIRSLHSPLEFAIFASDDPLPAFVEAPMLLYLWWKRRSDTKGSA